MNVRELSETEREQFDACLSRLTQVDLLQTSHWASHKREYGWQPTYLVVEHGGSIRGACLLLRRNLPLGRSLYYSPRGPCLFAEDDAAWAELIRYVVAKGRADRAVLWKVDPDLENRLDWRGLLLHRGFRPARARGRFGGLQPRHVCRLSLEGDDQEVESRFTSKCRYNIRLACRRGVEVETKGVDGLPEFYALLQETARRDRFTVRSPQYFASLFKHTVGCGLGTLLLARYRGEPVAGAWLAAFGTKAWYLYGASSAQHRETMPVYAVQAAAVRWARERGAKIYDFLGVPADLRPTNPLYGLYRFKRQFGATLTTLLGEFDLPLEGISSYAAYRAVEPCAAWAMVASGRLRAAISRPTEGALFQNHRPVKAPHTVRGGGA